MSSDTDPYILSRDNEEQNRLNVQHLFIKTYAYEGRLIFNGNVHLPRDAKVLDAGSGTGAWLLDLAREVPETTELHGVDVSADQFSKDDAPKNLAFHIEKITQLPQEWTGEFDFIHQRLLIGGLMKDEWPIALENFYRVLRPGGSVQLLEVHPGPLALSGPAGASCATIFERAYGCKNLVWSIGEQLPFLLKKAGFVNVRAELKLAPVGDALGEEGKRGKSVIGGSLRSMRDAFVRTGLVNNTEELFELIRKMEDEWNAMGGFYVTYCIATADKAKS